MVRRWKISAGLAAAMVALAGCAAPMGDKAAIEPVAVSASAPLAASQKAVAKPEPEPVLSGPSVIPPAPPASSLKTLTIVRSSLTDAPKTVTVEAGELPESPTKILDPAAAERLFGNTGMTLQWITWKDRGLAWIAVDESGQWLLTGGQEGQSGQRLKLEGFITEIGSDYFLYNGTIKILGAPDADRLCNTTKTQWRFAVTQNRKYWRLREFEWCDGLTDYIDIYF